MGTLVQDAAEVASCATAIDNAIVAKGGTLVGGGKLRNAAAGIAAIPSGSSSPVPSKAINFYNTVGDILYSYDLSDLPLAALPDLPDLSDEGLVAQCWNYTLAEVNSTLTMCDVGLSCVATDGSFRINLTLPTEGRTAALKFAQSASGAVTVDWGDGSATETPTATAVMLTHTYAGTSNDDVTIKIKQNGSGTFSPDTAGYTIMYGSDTSILTAVTSVNVADFFVQTGSNSNNSSLAFPMMEKLTFSSGAVGSFFQMFKSVCCVKFLAIPRGVTTISYDAFQNCKSLWRVSIPDTVTTFTRYTFTSVHLDRLVIPSGVSTDQNIGGTATTRAYRSSASITLPTYMQFQNARMARIVSFAGVDPSGGNTFASCSNLSEIKVSNACTALANNVFNGCSFLYALSFGDIASVGTGVFNGCGGLAKIDFTNCTAVPTLAATSSFAGTSASLKIIVPDALYDDWIAATNWSDSSIVGKIVKESEA